MSLFKRRRFPVEIIVLCVRWFCKHGISYRDLAEMMQERAVNVDPSTIFRWVQRYALRLRSEFADTRVTDQDPGGSVADGNTCSVPSTSTASSSTSC